MAGQPEGVRITATDGKNHGISLDHSMIRLANDLDGYGNYCSSGFGAHTIEIVTAPLDNIEFASIVNFSTRSGSGFRSFPPAREHLYMMRMYGVDIDAVKLETGKVDDQSGRIDDEAGLQDVTNQVEEGYFADGISTPCDRQLILPLRAGQLTVAFSLSEEFPPDRVNHTGSVTA
jgi:hypothetical protein